MATSLKARAMLTLAYGCGLRAGEVVRLRAGHIDSEQMIIRVVQSKGRKDRHVMLPPEVVDLLRQWWKARPTKRDAGIVQEQRWLFPGRTDHQPLTTRQFGRLFKEAAKAAGLRKTLSLVRDIDAGSAMATNSGSSERRRNRVRAPRRWLAVTASPHAFYADGSRSWRRHCQPSSRCR
jgi:integrase